jgi:hypothetical protein
VRHAPPYDSELALGVANQGFHAGQHFHMAEFSNGNGVYVAWMNVPHRGAIGSSPDFSSGRIIPNSLFPIHVKGVTLHNGADFNPFVADFFVPKLDANLNPPFNVDGHSHFPVFVADNADFGPPGAKLLGHYVYRLTIIDQSGNGWGIRARFTIGP